MKVDFERTQCSRCGGSGSYSYCQTYGTTCFKCGGTGQQLSKQGAKARAIYEAALTIPVSDLKTGDIVMTSELSGKSKRRSILSIGPSATVTNATSNGHPVEYTEICFDGMTHNTFATATMRLALSPAIHPLVHASENTPGLIVPA